MVVLVAEGLENGAGVDSASLDDPTTLLGKDVVSPFFYFFFYILHSSDQ